jgi:hypothetical protein
MERREFVTTMAATLLGGGVAQRVTAAAPASSETSVTGPIFVELDPACEAWFDEALLKRLVDQFTERYQRAYPGKSDLLVVLPPGLKVKTRVASGQYYYREKVGHCELEVIAPTLEELEEVLAVRPPMRHMNFEVVDEEVVNDACKE